jgi:hypothetical protein
MKRKDEYQPLAVEAAEIEIKNRNLSDQEINEINTQILNIEATEQRKKEFNNAFIEKAFGLFESLAFPIGFKSPSAVINSIGILILARVIWENRFFLPIYWLLKEGLYDGVLWLLFFAFLYIGIAILLFMKKKLGWILLSFSNIYLLVLFFGNLYISWFIYHDDPAGFFSFNGIIYLMFNLLIPIAVVKYIHKDVTLEYFQIKKATKKITVAASLVFAIILEVKSIFSAEDFYYQQY